jgi:hypothetical protein
MTEPQGGPDWVVVGWSEPPDGTGQRMVWLMASRTLDAAELTHTRLKEDFVVEQFGDYRPIYLQRPKVILRVQMDDYVAIQARTWERAWAALFEEWQPPESRPRRLRLSR